MGLVSAAAGVVSGPCPAEPEQSVVFHVWLYRVEYDVLAGVTVHFDAGGGKVAWFRYAPDAAVWLKAEVPDGCAAVDPLAVFCAHEAAWDAGSNACLTWRVASRESRESAQLARVCAWCANPPSRVVQIGDSARWEPACGPCRAAYVRGDLPLPEDGPQKPSMADRVQQITAEALAPRDRLIAERRSGGEGEQVAQGPGDGVLGGGEAGCDVDDDVDEGVDLVYDPSCCGTCRAIAHGLLVCDALVDVVSAGAGGGVAGVGRRGDAGHGGASFRGSGRAATRPPDDLTVGVPTDSLPSAVLGSVVGEPADPPEGAVSRSALSFTASSFGVGRGVSRVMRSKRSVRSEPCVVVGPLRMWGWDPRAVVS